MTRLWRRSISFCLFTLVLTLSIMNILHEWGSSLATTPATITSIALEDSYIDPRTPSAVYGGLNFLNYSLTSTNQTMLFLKFDISNLPPVTQVINATLTLGLLGQTNPYANYLLIGDPRVGAFYASSAWSENTLNYTNAPRSSISPTPSDVKAVASPGTYSWNVTSIVEPLIGKSARATVVLHHNGTLPPPPPPFPLLLFQSSDASTPTIPPTLTVTYRKNPSSMNTILIPSKTVFGTPVVINATLKPALKTGTVSIQFSTDNSSWSTINSGPPGANGSVITIWFPPIAGILYLRSTWSGDSFTENSTSPVQSLTVTRASTTTSIALTASSISYGNQALAIATLRPQLSDGVMIIEYSSDSGSTWTELISGAPANGLLFQPFIPSTTGSYLFRARWTGDLNYSPSSSSFFSALSVAKASTTLTLSVSTTIMQVGTNAVISGFLRATGGAAIGGASVTVQISPASSSSPSQSPAFTNLTALTTDIDGSFSYPWLANTNGTYQIRVSYAGTNNYNPALSRIQQVVVVFQLFPTPLEIGLIGGVLGILIGVGASFLVRFRKKATLKRRQRFGAKGRGNNQ